LFRLVKSNDTIFGEGQDFSMKITGMTFQSSPAEPPYLPRPKLIDEVLRGDQPEYFSRLVVGEYLIPTSAEMPADQFA
jgi:hypothetical protein